MKIQKELIEFYTHQSLRAKQNKNLAFSKLEETYKRCENKLNN